MTNKQKTASANIGLSAIKENRNDTETATNDAVILYIRDDSFLYTTTAMIDQTIISKWLDAKGDEALQKLLNHEPLTFEDDVVFCLVGQREELRQFKQDMDKRFDRAEQRMKDFEQRVEYEFGDMKVAIRELQASNSELNRRVDDMRKEMVWQTRWMLTGMAFIVTLVMALAKIFEMIK
jgi:hypothetical protein